MVARELFHVETPDVYGKVRDALGQRRVSGIGAPGAQDLVPAARIVVPVDQVSAMRLALAVGDTELAEYEEHVRARREPAARESELARHPFVVGVEKGDEIARRLADAAIARSARPAVLGAHVADAIAVGREHLLGAIARSVVHDDHLVARFALGEGGLDRTADQMRPVVGRNDGRDGESHADPRDSEHGSRRRLFRAPSGSPIKLLILTHASRPAPQGAPR